MTSYLMQANRNLDVIFIESVMSVYEFYQAFSEHSSLNEWTERAQYQKY